MKKSAKDNNHLIIQQCIDLLKRDDLKYELKIFMEPIITMFFNIVNPYIYIFLTINIIMFVMILTVLVLLIINHRNININNS